MLLLVVDCCWLVVVCRFGVGVFSSGLVLFDVGTFYRLEFGVASCFLCVVVGCRWCMLCVVVYWLLSFGVVVVDCCWLVYVVCCCCLLFGVLLVLLV